MGPELLAQAAAHARERKHEQADYRYNHHTNETGVKRPPASTKETPPLPAPSRLGLHNGILGPTAKTSSPPPRRHLCRKVVWISG